YDREALGGLLEVLEAEKRWADLVAGLRRRASLASPPLQKRADLIRIAELQARELERRDEAVATWRELCEAQGEDEQTTDALAALLETEGRWSELAELLDAAARRGGARWIDAEARLGDLLRTRLGDPGRAALAYEAVLRGSPTHETARAG